LLSILKRNSSVVRTIESLNGATTGGRFECSDGRSEQSNFAGGKERRMHRLKSRQNPKQPKKRRRTAGEDCLGKSRIEESTILTGAAGNEIPI
jgi:hypothetical protein